MYTAYLIVSVMASLSIICPLKVTTIVPECTKPNSFLLVSEDVPHSLSSAVLYMKLIL